MKKIIAVGLLSGVIVLGIGMLISLIFQALVPSLTKEYENSGLFRPWSDPLMMLYFAHPFLLSVILAWVWNAVREVLPVGSDIRKGIYFGVTVWLVSSVPGMLMSYASFQISLFMIASWLVTGFIELVCLGILFSKTIK